MITQSCYFLIFAAFQSTWNSSLKFPVTNGQHFPFRSRGQPGELYPNFR